ncbi:NAD-dependent epimerase/dehydratase family protein [Dongia deserti]|uniref:NAD-dependent epimerase/dehydratase family protein n=1 Tax=Dongia deserti TaxID=2268030 RepID=UPI000E656EF3|nr:SDR family oxidoreductase [Dongia deserti]
MRILVLGNMGYVGPAVVRHLRAQHPSAVLHGFDNSYFAHCLTGAKSLPEQLLDEQFFGDVRSISPRMFEGYSAVVQLAAISNDPMGEQFARVTADINRAATILAAKAAASAGVRNFVFASSCSVYGVADSTPRRESDPLGPVTAYAKSKVGAEEDLGRLDTRMTITCLRFATACGMSDRLRLDLVLNDFVACALARGEITVLSDGSPWRPLIDVADMARAIDWAILRSPEDGGRYLVVNTGSNDRNYQVRDLARAVAEALPGTTININSKAPVDSRSYRVDFSLFESLAPNYRPQVTLSQSIFRLIDGLRDMGFKDGEFRQSQFMRLQVLRRHIEERRLSANLEWLSSRVTSGLPKELVQ